MPVECDSTSGASTAGVGTSRKSKSSITRRTRASKAAARAGVTTSPAPQVPVQCEIVPPPHSWPAAGGTPSVYSCPCWKQVPGLKSVPSRVQGTRVKKNAKPSSGCASSKEAASVSASHRAGEGGGEAVAEGLSEGGLLRQEEVLIGEHFRA